MSDTAQVAIQRVTDTLYAPVRYTGSGSPEGVVASVPGWLYQDTLNQRLYVKDSGTGNTGWVLTTSARIIDSCAIPSAAGYANKTSVTHSLGRVPDAVMATFVCVSAELGYSIGDEVNWSSMAGTGYAPVLVWFPTTSTIDVFINSDLTLYLMHKTTGATTLADRSKWNAKFRAQIFPI